MVIKLPIPSLIIYLTNLPTYLPYTPTPALSLFAPLPPPPRLVPLIYRHTRIPAGITHVGKIDCPPHAPVLRAGSWIDIGIDTLAAKRVSHGHMLVVAMQILRPALLTHDWLQMEVGKIWDRYE